MRRHLLPRSGRSLAKSTLKRRLGRRRLELVERIGEVAAQQGWATYLVGGVVRDLLLGRATKDLDLVVVGNAPEVAALVARSEAGQLREHRAFGTASIEFEDGLRVDLATARRESYARPAALPSTIASGMVDDLLRRDFTINSLALDLSSSRFGEIMDPGRGRADVRRGLIRVLHERSFLDDPTRIFRALRFANRLGFEIETSTAALMHSASASGVVDRLSAARVRRELRMIFDEPGWAGAAGALSDYDLWTAVEPSLGVGRGSAGRVERAESWAEWYAATEGAESVSRWVLALAALAHGGARNEGERVVRRLRPGRQDATDLIDAPGRAREILRELRAARHPRPSRVFRICEGASVITCLVALSDTRAGAVRHAICGYLRRFSSFEADISGDDLLREGVPAGPLVGIGLRAALEAKLDGRASDASRQLAVAIRATRSRA